MRKDILAKTLAATTGKDLLLLTSEEKCVGGSADISYMGPRTPAEQVMSEIWKIILRHDQFGIDTNFFNVGGNSLKAVRLISAISSRCSVNIGFREIFSNPTVIALAAYVESLAAQACTAIAGGPDVVEEATIMSKPPLSFEQERLWFIDQLTGSVQYHIPVVWRIKGLLDTGALRQAMRNILIRHEILRTVCVQEGNGIWQRVLPADGWEFEAGDGITRPFDLSRDYPFRASLQKLGDREHLLSIVIHHIVSDGWSLFILFRELQEGYTAVTEDRSPDLPALTMQYADYAIRQKKTYADGMLAPKLDHWRRRLENLQPLSMPTDFPRPAVQSVRGAIWRFTVDRVLTDRVGALAGQQNTTLFMMLLTAFKVLLYRYSGKEDICVGCPVAGRQQKEWQGLIGFFVNMLPVRSRLSSNIPFVKLLEQERDILLEDLDNQDVPFSKIVEAVVKERQPSMSPLFQVSFVLQEIGDVLPIWRNPDGLEVIEEPIDHSTSLFDLKLSLTPCEGGLSGNIEYCTELYKRETIERMAGHFLQILHGVANDITGPIGEIVMLTPGEHLWVTEQSFGEVHALSKEGTVVDLILEQMRRNPHAIAIVYRDERITYSELDRRSARLADYLVYRGLQKEQLVPLCLESGPEMIVGLLGILRSGGCYVPIDPKYPSARIAAMLMDTDAGLIISDNTLKHTVLAAEKRAVISIDTDWPIIENCPAAATMVSTCQEDLAYVIFTSGSTGVPKGVLVEHGSLLNYLMNSSTLYISGEEALSGSFVYMSSTFDASLTAIFFPLIHGRSMVMSSSEPAEAFKDRLFLQYAPYEFLKLTPLHLSFLEEAVREKRPAMIAKRLVIGGEELLTSHIGEVLHAQKGMEIINEYGPTEATVGCSVYWHTISGSMHGLPAKVPIGRPIDNSRIVLTDHAGRLVPPCAAGEICISGAGLARGYLNRPELTTDRFIPASLVQDGTIRRYRTGDMGRWLTDGNLEYMGRMDDQLKVRGFRVEPYETEQVLLKSGMVKAAVVLGKRDTTGHLRLIGYVIPEGHYDRQAVFGFLREVLPDYQVPSLLIELDSMPLTDHGKVDKEGFPYPFTSVKPGGAHLLPRNGSEQRLLRIWSELLEISEETIGIDDNFFEVGGDSLMSVRLAHRIGVGWNRSMGVAEIFQYPTIRKIAGYLDPPLNREHFVQGQAADVVDGDHKSGEGICVDSRIAIIGISAQFPGSSDHQAFWNNLAMGRELAVEFSTEELQDSGITANQLAGVTYVRRGVVLEEKDCFDHAFFDYRPEEAALMDPQVRLYHEHCWKALEDAGYVSADTSRLMGIFSAASENDNWKMHAYGATRDSSVDPYYAKCIASHRYISSLVGYKLNIKGPVLYLDTACSSSLVGVYMACKSLESGECGVALAGGISVNTKMEKGYPYREGTVLSPDGRCRAFDREAAGTFPGEGVGVVVLKRLSDAVRDGDHIYSVILSGAINNDGGVKVGFTAPAVDGQSDCIRAAHRKAGIDVRTIGYVEAHGTGTRLGDPVEVRALNQAFGTGGGEKYCAIGSVKTNMGHLDAAAGIAGLIKAALSMWKKKIPPSLHYNVPNPEIDFNGGPFYINTALKDWNNEPGSPLRAGVSSFGIGGTNAHLLLEEAPKYPTRPVSPPGPLLLIWSAKSPGSLERYRQALQQHLLDDREANLSDMAFTLQTGRVHLGFRDYLLYKNREDLLAKLSASAAAGPVERSKERKNVFMFPGQGAEYQGMGKGLYQEYPLFRMEIDNGLKLLEEWTGRDLKKIYFDTDPLSGSIHDTENTQPMLFLFEYALARLLMSWGVEPDLMVGHSVGEYVAACLSGVFTQAEALKLLLRRGQLMSSLPAGAMLSVTAGEASATRLLGEGLSLAAVNTPERIVISGDPAAIEALKVKLGKEGVAAIQHTTSYAFHSFMLDPILADLKKELENIRFQLPKIPFLSGLTGRVIEDEEAISPDYWVRHTRSTVRFSEGISNLLAVPGNKLFVEVGPGNTLSRLLRMHAPAAGVPMANVVRHANEKADDVEYLLNSLGRLWTAGLNPDWIAFTKGNNARKVSLPGYCFERNKFPAQVDPFRTWSLQPDAQKGNQPGKGLKDWIYFPSWASSPLPATQEKVERRTYLFFSAGDGFCRYLAEKIRETHDVVQVITSPCFERISSSMYSIDPLKAGDMVRLMDNLERDGFIVTDIIYAWAMLSGRSDINIGSSDKNTHLVFFTVAEIVKAILKSSRTAIERFTLLTESLYNVLGDEAIHYTQSIALGMINVLSQEQQLCCRNIDVCRRDISDHLLRDIVREMESDTPSRVVAFRCGKRWMQEFRKFDIPVMKPGDGVRRQGLYLITGGLGKVGFILAEYLLRKYNVRLALVGRKKLPADEDGLRRLQVIQKEVKYYSCDITDYERFEKTVGNIEQDMGAINGVIHAAGEAGSLGTELIETLDHSAVLSVFAPKVAGIENIRCVFNDRDVDFVWVTSSLASIVGGLGKSAYVAANSYMDHFMNSVASRHPNWKTVCLGEIRSNDSDGDNSDDHAVLDKATLAELFDWSISQPGYPVLIQTGKDLHQRLNTAYSIQKAKETTTSSGIIPFNRTPRPEMSTAYSPAITTTETILVEILEDFFGIEMVGVDDDFLELGGDSLTAIMLLKKIRAKMDINLSIADLFARPNARKMAVEIDEIRDLLKKSERQSKKII